MNLAFIAWVPAGLLASVALFFAVWRPLRRLWVELFGQPRKAGENEPPLGLFEATKQNTIDVKRALSELCPNGGASMKDQVTRLEALVSEHLKAHEH